VTDNAFPDGLVGVLVTDPASIPDEPPAESMYRHSSNLIPSLRELWDRREMIFTLAERDIRSSYKQATLGIAWALITPIAQLVIFSVVISHTVKFATGGVPYPVYLYAGILGWNFFSNSLGSGGNSMLANMPLLQKTHFPRACFPLSQLAEAAVYTTIALVPLGILFGIYGYAPRPETLWLPLLLAIELAFTAGVVLAFSALVIYVRDLVQVIGLLTQLGLLATPVIWPFSKIPHALQPLYSVLNPLGPVIDNIRRTMLLGHSPDWSMLGFGAVGALCYMVGGYIVFKRLEVSFADIA